MNFFSIRLARKVLIFRPFFSPLALRSDTLRYFFVGGINTSITFLLYQLFLFFFSASVSYFFSWIIGFLLVVTIYPGKVFGAKQINVFARCTYALSYLSVFTSGLVLTSFLLSVGFNARFSILIVLLSTSLSNLVLGRFIFRRCSQLGSTRSDAYDHH